MTWLITGVTGLLGATAAVRLSHEGADVIGVSRRAPAGTAVAHESRDLRDARARDGLVAATGARVVLHTAAMASIDECERDPEGAHELNVAAAADLASQAASAGAGFIHISTDAVFDGTSGGYREDDRPSPLSVYGHTKRDAELAVLDAHPGALVARVNFYGWSPSGGRSLLEFFTRGLERGEEVGGFTDVTVSTMYAGRLISALAAAHRLAVTGVLHVAAREPITKFEFGRNVARRFGWDESLVVPIDSRDVLRVSRGSNLSLDVSRCERLVGSLPTQAEGLSAAYDDFAQGWPETVRGFHPRGDD